ncbi:MULTISPECIES: hypothetical protein [Stenotrophomonas]|uniref:hypothetical protein n=1 Tax=Stenotrophomonas TaxID=40323 RepID=UPI001113143E|nr:MULTISPECIES: hypothetical protein [Stenotrophomonas]MDX5515966.1 hypothetical protein [Stenotrophomonas sp. RG-453]
MGKNEGLNAPGEGGKDGGGHYITGVFAAGRRWSAGRTSRRNAPWPVMALSMLPAAFSAVLPRLAVWTDRPSSPIRSPEYGTHLPYH